MSTSPFSAPGTRLAHERDACDHATAVTRSLLGYLALAVETRPRSSTGVVQPPACLSELDRTDQAFETRQERFCRTTELSAQRQPER